MSLEEGPCSIRPEARPVPYMRYVHGTLMGPSAQAPVVGRIDQRIGPEPELAEWGTERVTGGWSQHELTLFGRTRAMREVLGYGSEQDTGIGRSPSLTLTMSGKEFPVHAEKASHTRDGYLSVKTTGQNLVWSSTVWSADHLPAEPHHLVPDGQRLLGHATVQLAPNELTPDGERVVLLKAWSECRRTLEKSGPYAPLFPTIEYTDRPSLVLRVLATEEILQGSFEATLIDGPAAGHTMPLPEPRRVIQAVPTVDLFRTNPEEIPGPVEYRPVPGRPRWYSVNGGPLT